MTHYTSTVLDRLSDGRTAHLIVLKNKNGCTVHLTNYGARLLEINIPDKKGNLDNIILKYETLADYEQDDAYLGATVGRFANRIANGQFLLNGKSYQLSINQPPHHIHGGNKGWDKQLWKFEPLEIDGGAGVAMHHLGKDGQEGYPGNLNMTVRFILTSQNQLAIEYEADADQDTIINPTNHAYFNLNGADTILNHQLQINSQKITIADERNIPNGTFLKVENTPFDFTTLKNIGEQLSPAHRLIGNGFDHNFVIDDYDGFLKAAATLYEPTSGRCLTVLTSEPGLQVYTGNYLGRPEKSNPLFFNQHEGICLETQHFPNSPNVMHFPSPTLDAEDVFQSATVLVFSIEEF